MRLNLPVIVDASNYESHFNDGVWQQARRRYLRPA